MPVQDTSTASSPFTEPFSSSHSLFTITSITMNSFAISDAAVDQLAVLFRQEETCYRTTDYFTQGNCQLTVSCQEYERQYPTSCNKMKQSDHQCGDNSLLMQWRKATCVWAFRGTNELKRRFGTKCHGRKISLLPNPSFSFYINATIFPW